MFNSTKYCRFSPGKDPSEPYPQILQELPGLYFRQTGNSTRYLFSQIMELLAPITMSSTIHDNACGPGTASSVILDAHPDIHLMIYGTDVNFWMVQEFNTKIKKRNPICVGVINDSEKLYVSDSCFTHSITNFGLSHSTSPLSWAKEIYRTLQPDGQAVITTWKRFGVGDVINAASRHFGPHPYPPLPARSEDLFCSGQFSGDAVATLMVEAGFRRERIQIRTLTHVATGEDLEGIKEFVNRTDNTSSRREVFLEARWRHAADEALEEEKREFGGVKFEAWAVIATK